MVLPITSSFLVLFRPVKYRIEALDVLYPLVRGWSVKSCFWSGQGLGHTLAKLGQPWSTLVKPPQTSRNALPAMFWEFLSVTGPLSGQTGSARATSFCMPTFEKFLGVKIGLWQLPLLCLAFLGIRNARQRINDSIFARSDFLDFRTHPWTPWKIFLGLFVTFCQTRWLLIGWRTGQKSKVDFRLHFSYFCFPFLFSSRSNLTLWKSVRLSVYSIFLFLVLYHFLFVFSLYFLCFHMLLYTFGIICTVSERVSAQNAFMYRNMYTHKWVFVGTYDYTYMLRKIKDKEWQFFGTMLCIYFILFFYCLLLLFF